MNSKVTIVMYHFVRDLLNSRYPQIKGLDLTLFRKQLEFFKNNYSIITTEQLLDSIEGKYNLPENSMLLTFDDGYIDQYTNVFPILMENGIQGFFSMPGKIFGEGKVHDTDKLKFILASDNIRNIVKEVFEKLNYYRGNEFNVPTNKLLYEKLAHKSRFDDKNTVFIKMLLQKELDERLRNLIVDELFKKYIPLTENAFAKELYVSYDQVKLMKGMGMYFGIHGYSHYWLNKLDYLKMKEDIVKALDVFNGIVDKNNWVMCYPSGGYNDEVINYISNNGCKLGFGTEVRVANINLDNKFKLPRLDTNDFPPKSDEYLNK
ncbi:polysaccharide deacetylase family protein [Clostridium beijerinckii]|uniref:polysaccharide deacetylase family protein n=1 Tax=Clostridium beijerinckii TaxID=1520 RepID=UPI001A9AC35C|nr:polysaccharide deacetylase family protein [Clostridium beijerinckii]NRT73693.1 peptidoglycan/xylan/chitin deacetylase (PgdA/CDA1 family) [Clostridium beijerinckii]